jgi:hypothetical protein
MQIVEPSGFADLDAARTLVEIANAAEVVHDGRMVGFDGTRAGPT